MAKVAAGWVFPTSGPTPAGMLEVPTRYTEAPEAIREIDLALVQWVLKRMSNKTIRDDYSARCRGSGRELFKLLDSDLGKALTCTKASAAIVQAFRHIFAVAECIRHRCRSSMNYQAPHFS